MANWMKLSHHLPYPLRVAAASLKGYYLKWWRYNRESEVLVKQSLEREQWGRANWEAWRQERLSYILHRAATDIPFYRNYWQTQRRSGNKKSWEYLENWPILEKEEVRDNPEAFIADDCNPRWMREVHTSGTTGTPLTLWQSRESVQQWYALFEARWRRWYGISRHDRWAILGGQLVTPASQTSPPYWVWNAGLNQLYMSAYHLSPENVSAYLQAMEHYDVHYVWGYASALQAVAQTMLERDLEPPHIQIAISNAEPLYDFQREVIEQVFDCPVRTTYGTAERVCGASECRYGNLHLWLDAGVLEVLDDEVDESVPAGSVGRIICTGLLNPDMPLIRYEIGDRGAVAKAEDRCKCGRALPMLLQVEGRMDDVVFTPDGRRIGRLDPIFKGDMSIREAQIIQECLDMFRIRFVPTANYTPAEGQDIAQRLRDRVGEVEVKLEAVDSIPRTKNGKFRAVINNLEETTGTGNG